MAQKTITVGTTQTKASLDTNFGNAQDNFTELYGRTLFSYPGSGIPNSTGSAWGTSYTLDTDLTSVSGSDDTIPSAKATKAALDLKANSSPGTLNLTSDTTITEAQILANRFITNEGATGETDWTLPTMTCDTISFTLVVKAAYVIEINPPSGGQLDYQGDVLTADYVIDSPAVLRSKAVLTWCKIGASGMWSIDVARGTFSNPGRVSD